MKSLFCMHLFVSLAGLVFTQESATVKVVVDNVQSCYNADKSQFNKCLLAFWTDMRPHLAVGIPEFSVPPLDPLDIGVLQFPRDSAVIQGEASFPDLLVKGMGNYTIGAVTADATKQTITVGLTYPVLLVDGRFHFDGNILLLPIKGDGPLNIQLDQVNATLVAHVERDGTGGGLILKRTDIDFNSTKVKLALTDFLGGNGKNSEAATVIGNLINDNSQDIFRELKPLVRVQIGVALTKVLAGVIRQLPSEAFIVN